MLARRGGISKVRQSLRATRNETAPDLPCSTDSGQECGVTLQRLGDGLESRVGQQTLVLADKSADVLSLSLRRRCRVSGLDSPDCHQNYAVLGVRTAGVASGSRAAEATPMKATTVERV